jgi:predicted ArsR family transcriptional regulator
MIVALLDSAGPLALEVIRAEVGVSDHYARELLVSLIARGYVRRNAFAYETTGAWDPDDDVRAR